MVEIAGSYTLDVLANLRGGIETGAAVLGKADVNATLNGEQLGAAGATAFVSAQFVHGRFSDPLVGESQAASNIEAIGAARLFEAWLRVVRGRSFLKAGLIDLNTQFDVQDVGRLFINASHGIGPDLSQTGANGPSIFPTAATSVVAGTRVGRLALNVGLFDAVSGDPARPRRTVLRLPGRDGTLLIGEAARAVEGGEVQLGLWAYTGRFEGQLPNVAGGAVLLRGNRGAYLLIERRLAGGEEGPRTDGWIRVGVAQAAINQIGAYLGGGVAHRRGDDAFGVAVAHARLGRPALGAAASSGAPARRAETNVELTYRRQLTRNLALQPNLQMIVHPGWVYGRGTAFVAGARAVASFN